MKRTLRAQADYRPTLLRNQLTSLVLFEAVTTTKKKAAELIPFANRFFNRIRRADVTAKRLANATLFDKNAVKKVFEEILPRYGAAEVTFVRHYRVLPRHGDGAEQVMVALLRPLQLKKTTDEKETGKEKPEKLTKKAPKLANPSKND